MIASKINVRRLTFDLKRGSNRMIPRSMPKRVIIMEIECAHFGKIDGFSRLPMALISDSALETIESNILTHVPTFYVAPFRRYAS